MQAEEEKNGRSWSASLRSLWDLSDCESSDRQTSLKRAICYVKRLTESYATHQCSLMACACSYCALLSLVPGLIVGISILGFVLGGSQHALNDVIRSVQGYVPINPGFLRGTLMHVLQDRRLIGVFGSLGLIYGAHQTFLAMEPAMNMIWVVPETRHWVRQRLVALGATLLTIVLLGADLAASAAIVSVFGHDLPLLSGRMHSILIRIGISLVPLLLTTLLFATLYQTLPARNVSWKPGLIGAVVAALLWQATKVLFGIFLVYSHSYDRLYGSLSGLVILVVWIYYSMAILLLGAEIAADYETMKRGADAARERARTDESLATAARAPRDEPRSGAD